MIKYSWLKVHEPFRQNYQYLLQYMWQLKCSLHEFIWTKWFINIVLHIPIQLSCPLPSCFNGWMKKHGFLDIFIVGNQKEWNSSQGISFLHNMIHDAALWLQSYSISQTLNSQRAPITYPHKQIGGFYCISKNIDRVVLGLWHWNCIYQLICSS